MESASGGFLSANWLQLKFLKMVNLFCLCMCRLTFSIYLNKWHGMFFSQKSFIKIVSSPNDFQNCHDIVLHVFSDISSNTASCCQYFETMLILKSNNDGYFTSTKTRETKCTHHINLHVFKKHVYVYWSISGWGKEIWIMSENYTRYYYY